MIVDDGSTDDTLAVAKAAWSGTISDCRSCQRSGFHNAARVFVFHEPAVVMSVQWPCL
jgi:hypothetical protein